MKAIDFFTLTVFGRYYLHTPIVKGEKTAFSTATDRDGRDYAVKFINADEPDATRGTFEAELEALTALAGCEIPSGRQTNIITPDGFPNIYYMGTYRLIYDIIVIDKLVTHFYDLEFLKTLSIPEHQNLACDMLDCIMVLHQHGFVHRQVKPQNFMLDSRGKVQLVDLSLSTRYRDPDTNVHHPTRRERFFYGSKRYGSINALRMTCQSRRDDLESLGYSIVEMMNGYLPWDQYPYRMPGETEIQRMIRMRISSSPWTLCEGLPKGLFDYMMRVTSMTYDETPDYSALREMLRRQ